jgi:hypothetical protein
MKNIAPMFAANNYAGSPLNGCLNDQDDFIADWKQKGIDMEVENYREKEYTHDKFLSVHENLAKILKPTGLGQYSVTVHVSGHGTYDKSTREADGYSEALYPMDGRPIFDYEYLAVLKKFDPRIDIFLILDTCFSGGMARLMMNNSNPHPTHSKFFRLHDRVPDQQHIIGRSFLRELQPNFTLLSGCGERQTSADFYYNGKYNGALSRFTIDSYKLGLSKHQLWDKVRNHLPSHQLDQAPELLGNEEWMKTGCYGVPVSKKCFLKFW